MGALDVGVHSCDCSVSLRHVHGSEDISQAKGLEVRSLGTSYR